MKQITVTDNNSWEGELFSFIFNNPSDEFVKWIDEAERYESHMSVKRDTNYTREKVNDLNQLSHNSYMDRYGFYKEPDILSVEPSDGYHVLFYKAVGIDKDDQLQKRKYETNAPR